MQNSTIYWIARLMRITLIQATIAMTLFGVGLAGDNHGQTLLDTEITIKYEDEPLKNVLSGIENQTSVKFAYSGSIVNLQDRVTLDVKGRNLGEVLDELLKPRNIQYAEKNDYIVLTQPKAEGDSASTVENLQNDALDGYPLINTVRGTVSDASTQGALAGVVLDLNVSGTVTDENGDPLPGATIQEQGTTNGTITDADGSFEINCSPDAILTVSFVGYQSTQVAVNNRSNIKIELSPDFKQLDAVVVVGYGKMKRGDLVGAVASANIEQMEEMPNVSILQSLQGNIPGLNVGPVDQAGESPTFSIRGQNTLSSSSADNAPLIILDGAIYRGNIMDLNTNDIASVDILKDASSTAVYGSQASNGVIVLTSKNGGKTSKPAINYSASYSLQVPYHPLEPMNGKELENFLKDVLWEDSRLGSDYLQPDPNFSLAAYLRTAEISENYLNGTENDWWGLLTGNGYISKQNISLQGKGEFINYFMSGGYTGVDGFQENEQFRKINYRINLDAKVTEWLNVGINSFVTSSDYSGAYPDINGRSSPFLKQPWAPIFDANGEYFLRPEALDLNPYLQMDQDDSNKQRNLFANIHSDIKLPFLEGFNYRINYTQNYLRNDHDNFDPWGDNLTGFGYKNSSLTYDWQLDNIISFNRTFHNDHNIDLTLLYGVEELNQSATFSSASNFVNSSLGYNSLEAGDATLQRVSSGKEKETSLYSMARLHYGFKDKYLVTGTIRRDGFSGFGTEEKIGFFPSLGVGWVISNENFFDGNVDWIDYLKLRASYGSSGRRAVGRYATQAVVGSAPVVVFGDGGNPVIGQWNSSLANDGLTWETTTGLNLGLDFEIVGSRLQGNIEYYENDTKDILYNIQLPTVSGFSSIASNVGKFHNRGIEFAITGHIVESGNFRWESTINYSRNRDKIISILGADNDQDADGREDDLIANNLFIGEPSDVIYNYEVTGIWQFTDQDLPAGFSAGQYKLADLNDDGLISSSDDRKILGYTDPSYRIGWANNFTYKNFSLYIFINSIQGGKDYYRTLGNFSGGQWSERALLLGRNVPKGAWDYWMPENPNAKFRRPDVASVWGYETGPLLDRSFIRLQDISLAYSFDESVVNKIGLGNLKVFVSGKNLLTITKWNGWDPETGQGLEPGRPIMTNYTFGINMGF